MRTKDRILFYIFDRNNPCVSRAERYYYYDINNKQYLDATSGAYNCVLGHTVPERVAEVLRAHTHELNYCTLVNFTNDSANRLAERLIELMPDYAALGFYQSGSDAVEAALRCALQATFNGGDRRRYKIIGRRGDYHGPTLGGMATSARLNNPQDFPGFPHIEAQDCLNCPYGLSYPSCELRCASALRAAIEREGPDTVAAFIGEPSRRGGPVPAEYWPQIREICDEYGILLISDEVLEGLWRTGSAIALKRWGVTPDIVATGKALGAGFMPIFATLISDRVRDTLAEKGALLNGHTFSGHILSCDIGLAVLDEIDVNNLSSLGVASVEKQLKCVLQHICERFEGCQVGQLGAVARLLIPCSIPRDDQPISYYLGIQRKLQMAGVHGFLLETSGNYIGVSFAPPFIADEEFFSELETRVGHFVQSCAKA